MDATTLSGWAGTKGVAVLSRYPLLKTQNAHGLRLAGREVSFGTLQATMRIDGLDHEVFSTRFAPMHDPSGDVFDPLAESSNAAGHVQAAALVRAVPSTAAVIFGGDFNANWSRPWSTDFRDNGQPGVVIATGLMLVEVSVSLAWGDSLCRPPRYVARINHGEYRERFDRMKLGWHPMRDETIAPLDLGDPLAGP